MTIEPLTPEIARELRLPAERRAGVDRERRRARIGGGRRAGSRPGDVILSVNGQNATTVDTVGALLDRVLPGRNARIVVLRRAADGFRETLVLVRKR